MAVEMRASRQARLGCGLSRRPGRGCDGRRGAAGRQGHRTPERTGPAVRAHPIRLRFARGPRAAAPWPGAAARVAVAGSAASPLRCSSSPCWGPPSRHPPPPRPPSASSATPLKRTGTLEVLTHTTRLRRSLLAQTPPATRSPESTSTLAAILVTIHTPCPSGPRSAGVRASLSTTSQVRPASLTQH